MRELSLFTGAGGGVLGTHLLGWTPVGYVEFNDYCQQVLAARIKDGYIREAPIFGDIRAFIGEGYARSYQGMVDVITAGFPCQPFSVAGKQAAEDDPRNMWPATAEVLRVVRPRFAFLENVPGLLAGSHGYFGEVLRDLAAMGYDARWGVLSAADAGAPHLRKRLWIQCEIADSKRNGLEGQLETWPEARSIDGGSGDEVGDAEKLLGDGRDHNERGRGKVKDGHQMGWQSGDAGSPKGPRSSWWSTEPNLGRVADGVAHRVDRLRALGNGQVPAVVRLAWEALNNS
jgi:DNA (cytosine-5)-methyltransferase 1